MNSSIFGQVTNRIKNFVKSSPITGSIVFICVAVYILQELFPPLVNFGVYQPILALENFQIWRFVTSVFMHGNAVHLIFNMYALVLFGPVFEQFFGWKKYLIIYAGSGLCGSVLFSFWWYTFGQEVSLGFVLGASGCIFGLFSGMIIIFRRLRLDPSQLVIIVIVNVALGFFSPEIAWQAHIGGMIFGILSTKYYASKIGPPHI